MTRSTIGLLLAGALLPALPVRALAQTSQEGAAPLEQVLAESADTPGQHQALASHYRARAADAKEKAESHRWMSTHYSGSLKPTIADQQGQHCARLAALYDNQAKTFDQLAQGHEKAAAAH